MAVDRTGGPTPFERLKHHYDDAARRCPECGYEDDRGHWHATSVGGSVHYTHVCPSCGAVDSRDLVLDGS